MRTSTFKAGRALLVLAVLLLFVVPVAAVDQISPQPILQFFDNNGHLLTGGKLFTYVAGSTTKTNTFTDAGGGTPNTNPILLNTRGEARVWLTPGQAYKFVLSPSTDTDPPTNAFWTIDNLIGVGTGTISSITQACGITATPNPIVVSGTIGLATIANNTVLGNVSGITACPVALTATQLTALCNVFSSSLKGCAPASGGGTVNFLRADGTWAAPPFQARHELTTNTNFYVATTGNDSNDCLTSPTACLTLQHVWNLVATLDLAGFTATVNIADGTYAGFTASGGVPGAIQGAASIIFKGNLSTPANVIISGSDAVIVSNAATLFLEGMTITAVGSAPAHGYGIKAVSGADVLFDKIVFNTAPNAQIFAQLGATISTSVSGSYTISGASPVHAEAQHATVSLGFNTITLVGTPAFSTAFLVATDLGLIAPNNSTFVGTCTGDNYLVTLNSIINTLTGAGNTDNNYIPCTASSGTSSAGGYYD